MVVHVLVFTFRDLTIDFNKGILEDITNTCISVYNLLISTLLTCLNSTNSPVFV